MKKVIFLFLLLLTTNICYAEVDDLAKIEAAESESIESDANHIKPVSDVSNLANLKFELTTKQKNKIHKIIYKTNEKIAKLEDKVNKTQAKMNKIKDEMANTQDDMTVVNNKKNAQIKELNTKITMYRSEMINISRGNKAKITKILIQSQNDYLSNSIN